ncbi:MAG: DUF2188 domain-containing protein [Deltaproteobacteria bacterium]|nr:DUF2188 domain-containing protein [Deltaproteobacteria bacterium]
MAGRRLHVIPDALGWAVREEGAKQDLSRHLTQAEAIRAAKMRVGTGQILVHSRSGRVQALDDPDVPHELRPGGQRRKRAS